MFINSIIRCSRSPQKLVQQQKQKVRNSVGRPVVTVPASSARDVVAEAAEARAVEAVEPLEANVSTVATMKILASSSERA